MTAKIKILVPTLLLGFISLFIGCGKPVANQPLVLCPVDSSALVVAGGDLPSDPPYRWQNVTNTTGVHKLYEQAFTCPQCGRVYWTTNEVK